MRKAAIVLCICAGVLFVTCSKSSNPAGGGGGGNNGTVVYTYTTSGDSVYIKRPSGYDSITAYSYCNGSTLVTGYDTSSGPPPSVYYNISGSTLTLRYCQNGCDTGVFTRTGSGTGLPGTWYMTGTQSQYFPETLIISSNTIATPNGKTNSECWSDLFLQDEWPLYSTVFKGSIDSVSCSEIKITGTTSGEQVTITWNSSSGNLTYTSSVSSHAQYTYYANATTCPDSDTPSWWASFLAANLVSTAKKIEIPSTPPVRRHVTRSLFW